MDASSLRAALREFTGTARHHRHWSGMRYTDGIRFVAETVKAYWLIDVIASWQPKALEDEWLREFQLWELFVRDDRTATIVCSRDSEDAAFQQPIEFTDFPLNYMKVYVQGGVIRLPSERGLLNTSQQSWNGPQSDQGELPRSILFDIPTSNYTLQITIQQGAVE